MTGNARGDRTGSVLTFRRILGAVVVLAFTLAFWGLARTFEWGFLLGVAWALALFQLSYRVTHGAWFPPAEPSAFEAPRAGRRSGFIALAVLVLIAAAVVALNEERASDKGRPADFVYDPTAKQLVPNRPAN